MRIFPSSYKRKSDLSDIVKARQERVRDLYRETLARPDETSTVGEVCIAMLPDGELRLVAINIEPEQVPAYLAAIDTMRLRLIDHQNKHQQQSGPAPSQAPRGKGWRLLCAGLSPFIIISMAWHALGVSTYLRLTI